MGEDDPNEKSAEMSVGKMLSLIWPVGVLASLINLWNGMETSVMAPYLYSRVQCCGIHGSLPERYDITDVDDIEALQNEARIHGLPQVTERHRAGRLAIPACSIPQFPPQSSLWSKSIHCVSEAYVQDSTQQIIGVGSPLQTVATVVVLPVGGALSDGVGRRTVLTIIVSMILLSCFVFLLDTRIFYSLGTPVSIWIGMVLQCPVWEPKDAAINAAIRDLVGSDKSTLLRSMSLQHVFSTGGWLVGFMFTFYILSCHLGSYFVPWIIYAGLAGVVLVWARFITPETLPKELQVGVSASMFNPFWELWNTLRKMSGDWLLLMVLFNGFVMYVFYVGFMTLTFSYISGCGFSSQETILPLLGMTVAQIIYLLVNSKIDIGVMNLYVLGNFLLFMGYVIFGPLLDTIGHATPYIAMIFIGMGLSSLDPAVSTIISTRVPAADQGKCQAVCKCFFKLGAIVGPPIWNFVLFDGTATGLAFIMPAIVSMAMAGTTTVFAAFMWATAEAYPPVLKLQESQAALKSAEDNPSYGSVGAAQA